MRNHQSKQPLTFFVQPISYERTSSKERKRSENATLKSNSTITAIRGILVGNAEDRASLSGCTVVLFDSGEVLISYVTRGGWPGTFDADCIRTGMTFPRKKAIILTGGDVFGFDATIGVRKYLLEKGLSSSSGIANLPNIVGATITDTEFAEAQKIDYAQLGYLACSRASTLPVTQGNIGGGMGATVGKFGPFACAMKGGLGSVVLQLEGGIKVGALLIVNAVGNIFDISTGNTIAGSRTPEGGFTEFDEYTARNSSVMGKGTTIGVVATNVALSHENLTKVAEMADDGLARAVRPVHMTRDGDTIFAVSTAEVEPQVGSNYYDLIDVVGNAAAEAVSQAVLRGVRSAKTLNGKIGLGQ